MITTGSIEGVLWGAFTGLVFGTIGEVFQGISNGNFNADGIFTAGEEFLNTGLTASQFAAQSVSHAAAGGVIAEMQGGQFGHGFAAAGVSKAVTPGVVQLPVHQVIQGAIISIVGGTVSEATGGKFANGAITAAMAFAYNHLPSSRKTPPSTRGVRPGGRGTNLDDADRARQGLAPRTRFQNAESSKDLRRFGTTGKGKSGRKVREFVGDFEDAHQLIRQFSPNGRLHDLGPVRDQSGRVIGRHFRGSRGETFTLRQRTTIVRGQQRFDGPPTVDINYHDRSATLAIKFIDKAL